ncbi:hypothetical protein BX600DRAFT_48334 [Xylariales sp. PMI_506]|nr:hypothetical protein BX600DRAFT_48334 [Xylariales sp. PMI_506]
MLGLSSGDVNGLRKFHISLRATFLFCEKTPRSPMSPVRVHLGDTAGTSTPEVFRLPRVCSTRWLLIISERFCCSQFVPRVVFHASLKNQADICTLYNYHRLAADIRRFLMQCIIGPVCASPDFSPACGLAASAPAEPATSSGRGETTPMSLSRPTFLQPPSLLVLNFTAPGHNHWQEGRHPHQLDILPRVG